MASNKIIRMRPSYIANAAANLVNPPTLTGGTGLAGTNASTYIVIRHIEIVNSTASAVTFSLYVGATAGSAGGTEVCGGAQSVPANSSFQWYGMLRLEPADFLSGVASSASSLIFHAEGEIGII